MAENKKSFVLYSDQRSIIDMLPDELAGQLIKHIYAYVNDENPVNDNPMVNLAFEPIKLQLKRDLQRWEETKEGRSKAGKASAEARRNKSEQQSTNLTNVDFVQQNSTNSTVNVNVNDNVNVTVNDNVKVNTIEERKLKFAQTLEPFLPTYGKELLNEFYLYWVEPDKSKKKMRFEGEKYFDVSRRLSTWAKKEKNFAQKKESTPSRRTTNEIFDKVKHDILNGQLEIKPII